MNSQAYRTLFPFFMMILVVLLLVWRLAAPFSHPSEPEVSFCTGKTHAYRVEAGDTCWDIAQANKFPLKELMEANRGLDCDKLTPGEIICLPSTDSERR